MYQSVRVLPTSFTRTTSKAGYSPRPCCFLLYQRTPSATSLGQVLNVFLPTVSMYQSVRVLPPSFTRTTSKAGYSPRPCCFSLYRRTPSLQLLETWAKRVKVVLTYCINVPVSKSTASKLHTDHQQGRVFSRTLLFLAISELPLGHWLNVSKWFLPTVSMYQSVRVLPPSFTRTTSKAGYSPGPCCFSLYQSYPWDIG